LLVAQVLFRYQNHSLFDCSGRRVRWQTYFACAHALSVVRNTVNPIGATSPSLRLLL
jgi:hypothetical protein